jgi:hypothetical protein
VRVEVPDPPVMLVGLRLAVRPALGFAVSMTVPVKPLTGATVIVAVAVSPAFTIKVVGLAVMVKSVTVRLKLPLLPVWTLSPL